MEEDRITIIEIQSDGKQIIMALKGSGDVGGNRQQQCPSPGGPHRREDISLTRTQLKTCFGKYSNGMLQDAVLHSFI